MIKAEIVHTKSTEVSFENNMYIYNYKYKEKRQERKVSS